MKNTYVSSNSKTLFFSVLFVLFAWSVFSQNQNSHVTDLMIGWDVCEYYPAANPHKSYVKVPDYIQQKISNSSTACSNFIVTYNGFTPEAEAAFQFAVDIWSHSIESPVPIRINANFTPLDTNVLGSAGTDGFLINIAGFPSNVAFVSALGEKLIGEDSNGPAGTSNDINANFSSVANFYFGLDGNPPNNQVDFVSVVLHEIGHGLGLFGFGRIPTDANGSPDPDPPVVGELRNQGFISSWDQFIENGTTNAITSFSDPSASLLTEFTNNNLFCNSPAATIENGGIRPSTFAPSTFNAGSSYSHWDESTYPAGSPNSLMTPFIAPGEAIHNPGMVTLGFMEDMGWTICSSALSVESFKDTTVNVGPNPFSNFITISLNTSSAATLTVNVLDINGRVILNTTETSENGTITLSNLNQLENAFYLLKITNESNGTSVTKKIIKN